MFNRKSGKKFIFLLFIGLLIVAAISLTCGQIKIPLHNTLSAIGYQLGLPFFDKNDFTQEQMAVVWYIRMPRMVVGLLVGAALGISGAVMQGIFSNPLADPGIIGVSSGAATGAVLSIALGWATESMFVMPAFAFCGSVCAVALTVFLAMRNGKIPVMTFHLNILVLGETEAKAVGMPVLPFRMGLLFVAAMTTATSVCVSGNIGFVGLVVPHMMRMIVGPDHRVLLPASALAGAAFLVICDSLGRIIIPPAEVRVGIMTALLGTPYFLYLLRRMQKQVF